MKRLAIYISVTLLAGCNLFKGGSDSVSGPHDFPYATPPAMLTTQQDVLSYLAGSFWDPYLDSAAVWNITAADSLIGGVKKEELNKAMMNYLMLLWEVPVSEAIEAQTSLMKRIETYSAEFPGDSLYEYFADTFHDALYDPVSEFRNEEFYLPVISDVIRRDSLSHKTLADTSDNIAGSDMSAYYHSQLATCQKNRIGKQVSDFSFTDKKGKRHTLYTTLSPFTLILFSNPGCPACAHIVAQLQQHPKISHMTAEGILSLLNIYIDEDLTAWYESVGEYPAQWLSGYNEDLSIRNGDTFSIRAIPSVYLLDNDKRILLKDVSLPFLLNYIEKL